jgi:hypothetical protein
VAVAAVVVAVGVAVPPRGAVAPAAAAVVPPAALVVAPAAVVVSAPAAVIVAVALVEAAPFPPRLAALLAAAALFARADPSLRDPACHRVLPEPLAAASPLLALGAADGSCETSPDAQKPTSRAPPR